MMFAGQVNWTNPADISGQRVVPENIANNTDSETAFALVYETILGLSDEQCSDGDASSSWPDTQSGDEPLANINFSSPIVSSGAGFDANAAIVPGVSGALSNGSIMAQIISRDKGTRVEPATTQGPAQPSGLEHNLAAVPNTGGTLNKCQLSDWMDAHALTRSTHHCAMYCRLGMEAAGLNTGDRPQSGDAGDYGPFLLRHGAQTVSPDSYIPQVGDVVVFNKTDQHPNGHIEMYDGQHWVSDFMQHSFSPYRDAASTPTFTIYRLG